MPSVVTANWALLVGMLFLMVGNGLQASLLGVRATEADFSTLEISAVMSAYFAGFLVSSSVTPRLIARVGHVRVFAALGSAISAALILFPALTDPIAWSVLRAVVGFCFCGVYITAESWLNNATTSANRGSALSAYMVVQMMGIVAGQALLSVDDPTGFMLFIIPSVLVSISFAPILLSVSPAPTFESTKTMSLRRLYRASPLGLVAMFLMGGVFSAQFGMSAVYATEMGFDAARLSAFLASFYVGAFVLQLPIGWLSDRLPRRRLILATSAIGSGAALLGFLSGGSYAAVLASALVMGGVANPLYALVIAYVNDAVEYDDMAAASGGLLFVNGIGAILGPVVLGAAMGRLGPEGFWAFCAAVLGGIALYAGLRMARRPTQVTGEAVVYAPVFPAASAVAMEAAGECGELTDGDDRPDGGNREAA
jgi:MFS family permease